MEELTGSLFRNVAPGSYEPVPVTHPPLAWEVNDCTTSLLSRKWSASADHSDRTDRGRYARRRPATPAGPSLPPRHRSRAPRSATWQARDTDNRCRQNQGRYIPRAVGSQCTPAMSGSVQLRRPTGGNRGASAWKLHNAAFPHVYHFHLSQQSYFKLATAVVC